MIGGALALVVLIAIGLMLVRYQKDMRSYRARLEGLGNETISTACGEIEYAQKGSGYPVLVVHGNGGGVDQGLDMASGYIHAGLQVIAPSRFGYLGTPMPANATVEMQADAYACLLDALGIEKAAVFTSSAGVTSVTQFALRHPERVSAIILHSPNSPGEVGLVAPPKPVFSAMLHSDFIYWIMITYFGDGMQSLVGVPKGFALTPELQEVVTHTLGSVMPVSCRADGMVFDTYVSNPAINDYPLEQISTPTLVISAADDPMTLHSGARNLAALIPGAQFKAIADGGHMMLGHTEEVHQAIQAFLSSAVPELAR